MTIRPRPRPRPSRTQVGLVVGVVVLALGLGACASAGRSHNSAARPAPTLTGEPITRLAVAGDTGTGPGSRVDATVEAMVRQDAERGFDGLVLLGDLIYPEGDAAQAPARISGVFEPLVRRGARLVPVLGNHDYMSGEQADVLRAVGRRRSWYVDKVGIVRVIVLDTERISSRRQTAWLERTLAAPTRAPWTVVAMHKPAFSAGYHGSDATVQKAWVPLFTRYGVPLVLAGHDHDYQRSNPIDGVTYIVSGGAATLRPTGRADFTAISASTRHFLDLSFYPHSVIGQAIDQHGTLVDSFEIRR